MNRMRRRGKAVGNFEEIETFFGRSQMRPRTTRTAAEAEQRGCGEMRNADWKNAKVDGGSKVTIGCL